jgi:hypothetical protein
VQHHLMPVARQEQGGGRARGAAADDGDFQVLYAVVKGKDAEADGQSNGM